MPGRSLRAPAPQPNYAPFAMESRGMTLLVSIFKTLTSLHWLVWLNRPAFGGASYSNTALWSQSEAC